MPLKAKSISFSYTPGSPLISDLSLILASKAKVVLVGPNGGGKTTLLRLLAGALIPDQGQISGSTQAFMLNQHLAISDLGASGGEIRMAALREAFASQADVLLLDEPTNDLDQDARAWLKQKILGWSAAIVMISHDPEILDLAGEIWELRQGKITRHPGGYQAFADRLDAEASRLQRDIESLRSETKKSDLRARALVEAQQKRMARGKKAGEKANLPKIIRGALKRQAETTLAKVETIQEDRSRKRQSQLRDLESRLRSVSMFEWDSHATRPPASKVLVRCKGVRLTNFKRALDFQMLGPKRIHVQGKNGSGKSTLLRALCKDVVALGRVTGECYMSEPYQLFDQSLSQFSSTQTLWAWFQEKTNLEVALARTVLGRLGFDQDEQLRSVSGLSGGERVRLEIAIALHAKEAPQLLLLDEPTNHLDIESRRILHSFVQEFKGGIILVSHDKYFVESLIFDELINLDDFI